MNGIDAQDLAVMAKLVDEAANTRSREVLGIVLEAAYATGRHAELRLMTDVLANSDDVEALTAVAQVAAPPQRAGADELENARAHVIQSARALEAEAGGTP